MVDRISRISEEIKREISNIIQNELKDPRLPKVVSITAVKVARDLKHAKIFVSVLGDDEEKKSALEGLKSAAGFIRREIGQKMQIRYIPELHFELDSSIEHGIYITKLIDETVK